MLKRFVLGFGIGYVLGARAGEERYEQIAGAGRRVADLPAVRGLADRVPDNPRETITRWVGNARERVEQVLSERADASDDDDEDDETADDEIDEDEAEGDDNETDCPDDFDDSDEEPDDPVVGQFEMGQR